MPPSLVRLPHGVMPQPARDAGGAATPPAAASHRAPPPQPPHTPLSPPDAYSSTMFSSMSVRPASRTQSSVTRTYLIALRR